MRVQYHTLVISCFLLFASFVNARIANAQEPNLQAERKRSAPEGLYQQVKRFVLGKRQQPQQQLCLDDFYLLALRNSTIATPLCSALIGLPTVTQDVEITPTVTTIDITTTRVSTTTEIVRITNTVTATTTQVINAKAKRAAAPKPAMAMQEIRNVAARIVASSTVATDQLRSFSSACSCLTFSPVATLSRTFTNPPEVLTIKGEAREVTTVNSTRYATVTTIITVSSTTSSSRSSINPGGSSASSLDSGSSSGSSSGSVGSSVSPVDTVGLSQLSSSSVASATTASRQNIPIVSPVTCPDAEDQTVSVVIGSERYDYQIDCDAIIENEDDVVSLPFNDLSRCLAACARTDNELGEPACRGVTFYPDADGISTCRLKRSTAGLRAAPGSGIISGLLVVVAVSDNSTNFTPGNSTATVTAGAVQTGAVVSSVLSPDFTYTTPPPIVSGGSTYYSSGTVFYTSYSSGGFYSWYSSASWYEYYATSWSTIYEATVVGSLQTAGAGSGSGIGSGQGSGQGGADQSIGGSVPASGSVAIETISGGTAISGSGVTSDGGSGAVPATTTPAATAGPTLIPLTTIIASSSSGNFTFENSTTTIINGETVTIINGSRTTIYSIFGATGGFGGVAASTAGGSEASGVTDTPITTDSAAISSTSDERSGTLVTSAASAATSFDLLSVISSLLVNISTGSEGSGATSETLPFSTVIVSTVTGFFNFSTAGGAAASGGGAFPTSDLVLSSTVILSTESGFSNFSTFGGTGTGGSGQFATSEMPTSSTDSEVPPTTSGTLSNTSGDRTGTVPTTSETAFNSSTTDTVSNTSGDRTGTISTTTESALNSSTTDTVSNTSGDKTGTVSTTSEDTTSSTSAPYPLSNSTELVPTASITPPASSDTISLASSDIPSPSENSTNVSLTERPRSGTQSLPESITTDEVGTSSTLGLPPNSTLSSPPAESSTLTSNVTSTVGTGFFETSNSTGVGSSTFDDRTGTQSLPTSVAVENPTSSASVPSTTTTESSNTTTFGTYTGPEDSRTGLQSIPASTGVLPSSNVTSLLPTLVTSYPSTSSEASVGIPSTTLNSTIIASTCPCIATASTVVVTSTVTVTDCPSVCPTKYPYYAGPPNTQGGSGDEPAATPSVARRLSGDLATQEQIDAACDATQLISNGGFEEYDDDSNAIGWNSTTNSNAVYFVDSIATQLKPARSGRRTGRVVSGEAGASITVSQALTLCPDTAYTFSAFSRQVQEDSECSVEFMLGELRLFTLEPGTYWERDTAEYVVGAATTEEASLDLEIVVTCGGPGDEMGNRVLDLDDISLSPKET